MKKMTKSIWNKLEDKKPEQYAIVLASDGINICMGAIDSDGILKLAQFFTYKNRYVLFLEDYKDNARDEVKKLIYWADVPGVPDLNGKTMNQYEQENKAKLIEKYKEIKELYKTDPLKAEQLANEFMQERDE